MPDLKKKRAYFKKWKKSAAGKRYMKAWRKTKKGKIVARRAIQKWYDDRRKNRPAQLMLYWIRARAKKRKIPFDLVESDIIIPSVCPVLGIPMKMGKKNSNNSPSLDRRIPLLGYVRGNISVISNRANTLKRDATVNEIERVLEYMKSILKDK
jgi:hypothetical protein